MFGTRPTGRLYYVWEFAEVRWRKIHEIREKLCAGSLDVSTCLQPFSDRPCRKGVFKIQKAIGILKEDGWVCIALSYVRVRSATHPTLGEAKKWRACRTRLATDRTTASIPKCGLGKMIYETRPGHTFDPHCPAQTSSDSDCQV